ncbi:MAG: single-stranded DNA-binding protein [Candidatus Rokuibacteriota bacterium]|nr:MAG: single-stranded DNA-binding protein [Candidatus Rokubacteria bacterium]
MSQTEEFAELEATGETVGEAKWLALRELEKLYPRVDRETVEFQVLSEGERGLLGVGRSPARVLARLRAETGVPAIEETKLAQAMRDIVGQIADALGLHCRIGLEEADDAITATLYGNDLGLVIGKHGQTIDAIQYLTSAIVHRQFPEEVRSVVVDASGYRERRRERLHALALRSAQLAMRSGEPVELEPMTSAERKIVHLRLQELPEVETRSEGDEPARHVVIVPVPD